MKKIKYIGFFLSLMLLPAFLFTACEDEDDITTALNSVKLETGDLIIVTDAQPNIPCVVHFADAKDLGAIRVELYDADNATTPIEWNEVANPAIKQGQVVINIKYPATYAKREGAFFIKYFIKDKSGAVRAELQKDVTLMISMASPCELPDELKDPGAGNNVVMVVKVPENTPDNAEIWLIGTMNNWSNDVGGADPKWKLTLIPGATKCYYIRAQVVSGAEFKFRRSGAQGDWSSGEMARDGSQINNRVWDGSTPVSYAVSAWADIPAEGGDMIVPNSACVESGKVTIMAKVNMAVTPTNANLILSEASNLNVGVPMTNNGGGYYCAVIDRDVNKQYLITRGTANTVQVTASGGAATPFKWNGQTNPQAVNVEGWKDKQFPAEVKMTGASLLADVMMAHKGNGKYEGVGTVKTSGDGFHFESTSAIFSKFGEENTVSKIVEGSKGTLIVNGYKNIPSAVNEGMYKVSIDLVEMTYVIEKGVPDHLYLVGSFNGWDVANAPEFTQTSTGVFEIMVTLAPNDVYKFVQLREWGGLPDFSASTTTLNVEGNINSGGDSPPFAGPAGKYKIKADFTRMKTIITPASAEKIYIIGDVFGNPTWDNAYTDFVMFRDNNDASSFVYTYTGKFKVGEFKMISEKDLGTWNNLYGDGGSGKLSQDAGAGNLKVATEGYYTLTINTKNLTYTMVPYNASGAKSFNAIGLIGAFNSWNSDMALTVTSYDPHIWVVSNASITAGELKFRGNNDWADDWGSGAAVETFGKATYKGGNMTLSNGGKFWVKFNDLTGHYVFIVQ